MHILLSASCLQNSSHIWVFVRPFLLTTRPILLVCHLPATLISLLLAWPLSCFLSVSPLSFQTTTQSAPVSQEPQQVGSPLLRHLLFLAHVKPSGNNHKTEGRRPCGEKEEEVQVQCALKGTDTSSRGPSVFHDEILCTKKAEGLTFAEPSHAQMSLQCKMAHMLTPVMDMEVAMCCFWREQGYLGSRQWTPWAHRTIKPSPFWCAVFRCTPYFVTQDRRQETASMTDL